MSFGDPWKSGPEYETKLLINIFNTQILKNDSGKWDEMIN